MYFASCPAEFTPFNHQWRTTVPMTITAGLSKKVGTANYGSVGAICNITFEADHKLLEQDLDGFQQRVKNAFVAARQAVYDQLNRELNVPTARVDGAAPPAVATASSANGNGAAGTTANDTIDSHGNETNAGGQRNGGSGHPASERQLAYARQLANSIEGLGLRRLETLAAEVCGKPIAALSSVDASGLIETLKSIRDGLIDLDSVLQRARKLGLADLRPKRNRQAGGLLTPVPPQLFAGARDASIPPALGALAPRRWRDHACPGALVHGVAFALAIRSGVPVFLHGGFVDSDGCLGHHLDRVAAGSNFLRVAGEGVAGKKPFFEGNALGLKLQWQKTSRQEVARVKLACLRMLAGLSLDPARRELISAYIDSFLPLTDTLPEYASHHGCRPPSCNSRLDFGLAHRARILATSGVTCAANPGAGRNVTTTEPLCSSQTGAGWRCPGTSR